VLTTHALPHGRLHQERLLAAKNQESDGKHRWFWDRLDRYLATQELKQTRQRRLIVQNFLETGGHTDAEGLYRRMRREHKNIGLATIYRTLNLLKSANLAVQHSFADGRAVFEPLLPDEHHDHLVCMNCHKVVEFKNDRIEQLQKDVAQGFGFTLVDHRLDLFGLCTPCQNK
jgi:Fur family ferric uptake transcriptional regulator